MKKSELRDKIKMLVQKTYKAKTIDLDKGGEVTLDAEKFPVLTKFPKLKEVIVDLLTDQYEIFMTNIEWVAPRPTTFKIILANQQFFYLIYTERAWIAQVEGKKYYLSGIDEEERAAQAIARILMYGSKTEPSKEEIGSVPTGGETPPDETTPETPPAEETPPAPEGGEEVPEELPV